MHAVATLYFAAMERPVEISSSVIVGWRREWSIILARMGRDTDIVGGNVSEGVMFAVNARLNIGLFRVF